MATDLAKLTLDRNYMSERTVGIILHFRELVHLLHFR
jgi:hypothetical protein